MFEGLFQPMHLFVIVGLALLMFGPKKLPELGKGIGDGIRGFKSAINGNGEIPDQDSVHRETGISRQAWQASASAARDRTR